MRETQTSVNQWQEEQFPNATTDGIIKHLREEFNEFLDDPSPEEAADIVILLYAWANAWANKVGIDLHDEVDKKMIKNRNRSWNIQPDGTGRHV